MKTFSIFAFFAALLCVGCNGASEGSAVETKPADVKVELTPEQQQQNEAGKNNPNFDPSEDAAKARQGKANGK
jgi:hypothetical protein